MSFVVRSLPPERDDDVPAAMPSRLERLEGVRAVLIARVRRGCRSERQRALLQRIAETTRACLAAEIEAQQGDPR